MQDHRRTGNNRLPDERKMSLIEKIEQGMLRYSRSRHRHVKKHEEDFNDEERGRAGARFHT